MTEKIAAAAAAMCIAKGSRRAIPTNSPVLMSSPRPNGVTHYAFYRIWRVPHSRCNNTDTGGGNPVAHNRKAASYFYSPHFILTTSPRIRRLQVGRRRCNDGTSRLLHQDAQLIGSTKNRIHETSTAWPDGPAAACTFQQLQAAVGELLESEPGVSRVHADELDPLESEPGVRARARCFTALAQ